jgi:putative ABC transport system permease protein
MSQNYNNDDKNIKSMFKNYLKISFRSLMKNKVFSFINILGLSIGLTCCILITLYIVHETSYDHFQKNNERIFQIATQMSEEGIERKGATVSAPVGRLLQLEYPEVQASTKLLSLFSDDKTFFQVKKEDKVKSFYESNGFLADSNFFQLLDYSFKEGDPNTALSQPNTVVINEDIAKKLFGNEPALDKIVRISSSTNGDSTYRVSGVFAEPPGPTHINAHFFMSFSGGRWKNWRVIATI